MKKYFNWLALVFVTVFSFAQIALANDCPETKSATKKTVIRIKELYLEHNMLFIGYYANNSEQKQIMQINYGDREIFAKFMSDAPSLMEYQDVQYFDEMRRECTKTQKVQSINGIQLP